MPQFDLLDEMMNSHPNEPATTGMLALLRMETKSEFKSLRSEMNQRFDSVDRRFDKLEGSIELIAQKLNQLISKGDSIAQK